MSTVDEKRAVVSEKHYPALDGLRGVACLLVLFLHCIVVLLPAAPGTTAYSLRLAVLPFFLGGVDLFFVLSGFLIAGILLDNKAATNYFATFWLRRMARIFPVYYLVVGSYALFLWLGPFDGPSWVRGLFRDSVPVWSYATFTQNVALAVNRNGLEQADFVAVTWSLAIEEQFYLLLPCIIYLVSRRSLVWLAVAGIVLTPLIRGWCWQKIGFWEAYVLLFCRIWTRCYTAF